MLHANLVSALLQMQNSPAQEVRAGTPLASQAFPQLSVGQALTATIVSQLAGGLFLAEMEGHAIQLSLPANVVPGNTVSLRVLRAQPDYVFELLARTGAGAPPGAEHQSFTALSQGAQIIQLALGEARGTPGASLPAPAPLLGAAPETGATAFAQSISAPRPDATASAWGVAAPGPAAAGATPAQQLAAALRDTIANSGLFYESHLADWVEGRRELADLRREPQAQWRNGNAGDPARAATAGGQTPGLPVPVPDSAGRGAAAERALALAAGTSAAQLPEDARPVLRQQLEVLESRQIAWQGPVWPGQEASLTIIEESTEEGSGDGGEDQASRAGGQATWRTTLDLSLPQLGTIHADLVATGEALAISVAAPDAETARILRSGLPALEELLRAAGLCPQSITAAHDA